MIERVALALVALLVVSPGVVDAATWQERPDWAQFFQRAGVGGTIVILDQRAGADARLVHGAGIVRDEFQAFRWDGTKREAIARDVLRSIEALPAD